MAEESKIQDQIEGVIISVLQSGDLPSPLFSIRTVLLRVAQKLAEGDYDRYVDEGKD